jgi:hypothetical protein
VHMASPSSGGATIVGPYGTRTSSSSSRIVIAGPYGTRTSSLSGRTVALTGYDNESSSPTCMCFALGTSSSPMCVTPNSSFIISNIFFKHRNRPKSYTNSLILERELSAFFEKKNIRVKNLPIGVVRLARRGGGGLILQMDTWLGFRRTASVRWEVRGYDSMNRWCVARKMSLSIHPRDMYAVTCRLPHHAQYYNVSLIRGPDHSRNGRVSHHLDRCYWES